MVDAVAVIDSKGIVQFVNKSFVRLLGYSKDELVRQNITAIMKVLFFFSFFFFLSSVLHLHLSHSLCSRRTPRSTTSTFSGTSARESRTSSASVVPCRPRRRYRIRFFFFFVLTFLSAVAVFGIIIIPNVLLLRY